MRTYVWLFLSLSLATLMPSSSAPASLDPDLDLDALCNAADLIAVGRVADVRRGAETAIDVQGQSVRALSMTAELSVQSVLKGKLANSKLTLKFFIPPPMGYKAIERGQFGVFFLRDFQSAVEVLDPYHPYVAAAPGAPRTLGTYLDQVTAELAHVVTSPEPSPQATREAVEALSTLATSAATAALKTAAGGRDPGTRALAIAALLERGDMAWVEPAASVLLSREQSVSEYAVWRLATAIEARVKDPTAIPALSRLLGASDVTVRRAAAAALRNTGDGAAMGPLSQALNDTDDEVVYQAVFGLAGINGDLEWGPPPMEDFKKERQKYVTYWQNWAKSRKRE